jgi:hypothetical protein
MSLYDYQMSIAIDKQDLPFYAMLMALMRKADFDNQQKLKVIFPSVWKELEERYNSPGGILKSEETEMFKVGDQVTIKGVITFGQDHQFFSGEFPEDLVWTITWVSVIYDRASLIAKGYGEKGNYGNGSIYITKKSFKHLLKTGKD